MKMVYERATVLTTLGALTCVRLFLGSVSNLVRLSMEGSSYCFLPIMIRRKIDLVSDTSTEAASLDGFWLCGHGVENELLVLSWVRISDNKILKLPLICCSCS